MTVRGIGSRVGVYVVLPGHTKLSQKLKNLRLLVPNLFLLKMTLFFGR